MKLFNQTDIPRNILHPILSTAAQFMGCKHKDVAVRVAYGNRIQGFATNYWRIKRNWKQSGGKFKEEKWIDCKGLIEIWILKPSEPLKSWYSGSLRYAEMIWETAIHEFGHIVDFHSGRSYYLHQKSRCESGRRKAWEKRPTEISVMDQIYDKGIHDLRKPYSEQVVFAPRTQEAIINLAEWYEDNC